MQWRLGIVAVFAIAAVVHTFTAPLVRATPSSWAEIRTQVHNQGDQFPPVTIFLAHASIRSMGSSAETFLGKRMPAGSYWWITDVEFKNVAQKPVKVLRLEWILYDAARKVMRTETAEYQRFSRANISRPELPVSPLGAGEFSAALYGALPVDAAAFGLGHYALVLVLNASFTDGTAWTYQFPK